MFASKNTSHHLFPSQCEHYFQFHVRSPFSPRLHMLLARRPKQPLSEQAARGEGEWNEKKEGIMGRKKGSTRMFLVQTYATSHFHQPPSPSPCIIGAHPIHLLHIGKSPTRSNSNNSPTAQTRTRRRFAFRWSDDSNEINQGDDGMMLLCDTHTHTHTSRAALQNHRNSKILRFAQ
jgi:hypothetical protein